MDNHLVIQSLTESFGIIKDSWATKRNAIIDCIVETEKYDGDLAMDMWLYILKKEGEYQSDYVGKNVFFGSDIKFRQCIGDVFKAFFEKYEDSESPRLMCRVLFDHIVPHIVKKDELLEILFQRSDNMGYCTETFESDYPFRQEPYKNEFIPALIACIFLIDNPLVSQKLLNYMINWSYCVDWEKVNDDKDVLYSPVTIGELIRISKEYIQAVYMNKEDFDVEYKVTNRVKEALLSCIDKIEYAENRAECTIEILSL